MERSAADRGKCINCICVHRQRLQFGTPRFWWMCRAKSQLRPRVGHFGGCFSRQDFAVIVRVDLEKTGFIVISVSVPCRCEHPDVWLGLSNPSRGVEFGLHFNPILPASAFRARGFSSEHLIFGGCAEPNRSRGRGWAILLSAFRNMSSQ